MLLNFNIQKAIILNKELRPNTSFKEIYKNFLETLQDFYYEEMQLIGLIEVVGY